MDGKKRHPLLGTLDEDAVDFPLPNRSLVGKLWDDEKGGPVEPPPPLPPVNIAELAEEQEPGIRTLLKKAAGKLLRKMAGALDGET